MEEGETKVRERKGDRIMDCPECWDMVKCLVFSAQEIHLHGLMFTTSNIHSSNSNIHYRTSFCRQWGILVSLESFDPINFVRRECWLAMRVASRGTGRVGDHDQKHYRMEKG